MWVNEGTVLSSRQSCIVQSCRNPEAYFAGKSVDETRPNLLARPAFERVHVLSIVRK